MDDVLTILKETGAILEGHFIGTSGRHLALYVNKDLVSPRTSVVSRIGQLFAELNKDKGVEVVVSPAVGAIALSQWTAFHLSQMTGKEVLSLFTEKTPDENQVFKRGYDALVKGKNVLIVEDVVTTGGSVKKTFDAVVAAGGNVVQVSLMVNRDPEHVTSESMGFSLNSLGTIKAESWGEDEVPEWLKKIPISTMVGHGAKYLKEHPQA